MTDLRSKLPFYAKEDYLLSRNLIQTCVEMKLKPIVPGCVPK